MSALYDVNAPKKATNLSVNADLLSQAKRLDLNVSSVLEAALIEVVKKKKRELWLAVSAEAIGVYNEKVAEYGLFSDELGTF
jgi:antitoxin CcdA